MPMTAFSTQFPDLASQEMRSITVVGQPDLPDGKYGFLELYCDEEECDCRRAFISVISPQWPDAVLATINFGWESLEFYWNWMHDKEAAEELKGPALADMAPQSRYAPALLRYFVSVLEDTAYVERLRRHYQMFKAAVDDARRGVKRSSQERGAFSMEVPEILEAIRHNKGRFARDAVAAAIEKREEITPHLLGILEDTIERAGEIAEELNNMAHIYALHLLAQFRETRAYPLVARLFSLPGKVTDELTGDFLTEGLGPVLASVARGDPSLIKALIENREAFVWARVGALRAIPAMVGAQELSREEALSYFQELFRGKLEQEPFEKVSDLWDALVHFSLSLYPEELYDDIKGAYEKDLVNPGFVGLEDVDRWLSRGKEETLQKLPKAHPLITDTIEELYWWACFEDDHKEQEAAPFLKKTPPLQALRREPPVKSSLVSAAWPHREITQEERSRPGAAATILRNAPKVGRNDPCPCGSGKKHKNCCGTKERAGGIPPMTSIGRN